MALARAEIVARLQREILQMEGFRPAVNRLLNNVLGPLEEVFPSGAFPLGMVHEFQLDRRRIRCSMAATVGFISAMVSPLLLNGGLMLWLGTGRSVFPPALMSFGVRPDRVIFIDIQRPRDVLWATEEALKCGAVSVVVAEVGGLDLTVSRRLQLSAEQSKATGLLIRTDEHAGITSSASRWRITPVSGQLPDGLPGVGFPQWKVELLRLRNGTTGSWQIQYRQGRFESVNDEQTGIDEDADSGHVEDTRKTG